MMTMMTEAQAGDKINMQKKKKKKKKIRRKYRKTHIHTMKLLNGGRGGL